jgi:hypothetical protein
MLSRSSRAIDTNVENLAYKPISYIKSSFNLQVEACWTLALPMASRAWLAATVLAACSAAALADGNLTASGYDVDGNMFKEAGLTRKFDPKDKSYIMHLIWIAMPGTFEL